MKKQLIITSILALGMGIAGAQTQTPAPMQSGAADPGRGTAPQQQTSPASAAQDPGTGVNPETAPQSFKGCLNGSPGSWSLSSDDGKNLVLSGTDDKLSPYKGQEVRIQGTRSDDGTIKIDSIDQVSTSRPNQTSSNMSTQSTTTSQPASSTESSNQANTSAPATTDNSAAVSGQSTSTTSTTTPPVSDQTPANTVGSGQSTAQPSPGNAASGNTTNQNAVGTGSEQNANQGVKHFSDMDENAGQKLPQTASPLPLLGLLGLGSLAAGLIGRRKQ
jgi:hypothetical protein